MMATWAQRFATAIERPAIAYGMVAGAVAAATAAQGVVDLALTAPPAFMIYFPAIIFATVVAGARGGLTAVALSALVAASLWPTEARAGASLPVSVGLFVLTGALTVALAKPLRVAIRRSATVQERFRLAQQAAKDSFVILDPVRQDGAVVDFVWVYANAAADRMAPTGVETLVGRRVREVFPDDTGEDMFERLSRALTQDEPDDVEVLRVIDGQEHWVRSSALRAGAGVAVTFRDVSELRRTVETLRRGEARVRAFIESLPQLMWVSDAQGAWTFASPQWNDFTGGAPGSALGDGWLQSVHPEDRDAVAEAWRQAVSGALPFAPEFRLRRADGAWRWFHGRAAVLPGADGEVRSWFGSASDITEVVEARQDLEARVAERTRDLEASLEARARTEATLAQAQRLETVGRLTGGVAHDFNNLLTVVIGGLDMMLKDPSDTARVTRLASAALAAGRRGERLTRQLLAFSRRQELRLEDLSVAPLVEQIEPLIRRAAGEAITLTLDCPPEVGAARLDAAQFEAALLNLVVNAADATPPGGSIAIEAVRTTVAAGQVRDAEPGPYVRLSVSDTGSGMAPEVLEHVFEPFFTTKETGKGTGLGLAQVYGFIRQCGGAVEIRSAPHQGSTISLYLPAAEAAEPAPAPPIEDPEPEALLDGLRILLVEDDDAVRAVTESLLDELGCRVETAVNGVEALRRLGQDAAFDLVLSDIVMPGGVSGVDLARRMKVIHPGLPIVLATGYSGETLDDPEEADAWPILRKPFRAEQLSAVVRQAAGVN